MAERSRWAPGATVLAAAARAVAAVAFGGRSAEDALESAAGPGRAKSRSGADTRSGADARPDADTKPAPDARPDADTKPAGDTKPAADTAPRAAVRALTLGTLRWYLRLTPAIERLLQHPAGLDELLRALLVVAAHQIEYSRNPAELTVHAAVDATRVLRLGRASGLVNAVLRRFVRERVPAELDADIAVRSAHPQWLVDLLTRSWPEHVQSILESNNQHPPLVLRVDLTRGGVADYLQELSAAQLEGAAIGWAPAAVRVGQPVPVDALPGFAAGRVSVQDAGAQLAAILLDAQPGMRVLDACAAPGGKTGHILERQPQLTELLAVDIDAQRVSRIRSNLTRLGREAVLRVADVREPATLSDAGTFQRILVDAPCSSTGVIRRHPDIKLLRRPADIARFAATQRAILEGAFALLAPGGRLLYGTCSLLPEENEGVIRDFLSGQPAAREVPLDADGLAPGALQRSVGVQLLPGAEAGSDGFYYACLEKTTAGT